MDSKKPEFITLNLVQAFIDSLELNYFYQSTLHNKYIDILSQVMEYRMKAIGVKVKPISKNGTVEVKDELVPYFTNIIIPEAVAIVALKTEELAYRDDYQNNLKQFYIRYASFEIDTQEPICISQIVHSLDEGLALLYYKDKLVYKVPDYMTGDLIKKTVYKANKKVIMGEANLKNFLQNSLPVVLFN